MPSTGDAGAGVGGGTQQTRASFQSLYCSQVNRQTHTHIRQLRVIVGAMRKADMSM